MSEWNSILGSGNSRGHRIFRIFSSTPSLWGFSHLHAAQLSPTWTRATPSPSISCSLQLIAAGGGQSPRQAWPLFEQLPGSP